MALALYTGQRRSDLVRMGKQHIRDGRIQITQQKTKPRLAILIHPELQAVLNSMRPDHVIFLTTAYGQPLYVQRLRGLVQSCMRGLPRVARSMVFGRLHVDALRKLVAPLMKSPRSADIAP